MLMDTCFTRYCTCVYFSAPASSNRKYAGYLNLLVKMKGVTKTVGWCKHQMVLSRIRATVREVLCTVVDDATLTFYCKRLSLLVGDGAA
jgi:hypothetical protein